MIVNYNLSATLSSDSLAASQSRLAKSLARISSGSKIAEPSDDAAGLAVGSRLDAEIHRTEGAKANIGNAISFVQTQEGYLKKIAKALDRMSELSLLAQDVTKTDADRDLYDKEFQELNDFIGTASQRDFNGVSLFDGAANLDVTIDADGNTFTMSGIDLAATTSATSGSAIGDVASAATALTTVKAAITELSEHRATVGAFQAHLNYSAEQMLVSRENLQAASSRIQDINVAEESTEYARANVMSQASTAMLAQANQLPQQVLRLLQ
jgi:flagellin